MTKKQKPLKCSHCGKPVFSTHPHHSKPPKRSINAFELVGYSLGVGAFVLSAVIILHLVGVF